MVKSHHPKQVLPPAPLSQGGRYSPPQLEVTFHWEIHSQAATKSGGNQQQTGCSRVHHQLLQQLSTTALQASFYTAFLLLLPHSENSPNQHFRSLTNTGCKSQESSDWFLNRLDALCRSPSDLSLERHVTHRQRMLQNVNHSSDLLNMNMLLIRYCKVVWNAKAQFPVWNKKIIQ